MGHISDTFIGRQGEEGKKVEENVDGGEAVK